MTPMKNKQRGGAQSLLGIIIKVGLAGTYMFGIWVMFFAEEREALYQLLQSAQEASHQQSLFVLRDNILEISAEQVWRDLLEEGASQSPIPGIVMEVGMHRAIQCMNAAKAGFHAHCVEPSPNSFQRVQNAVLKAPADVQERIHLYQVAASSSSEGTVPFTSSGGTGDHVGGHDMWAMEEKQQENDPKAQVIQVPTKKLDDIVIPNEKAFLLKVDTQGFEPTVFSGLTESLAQHKIQYVLTEFWPRGMDLLAGRPNECIGAQLLETFLKYGYTLYAMPVAAHPLAPRGWTSIVPQRPLHNVQAFCEWYFYVERAFPSKDYKMGYWSDILAVAPGATLPSPKTQTGKALTGKATL
ncbi:hypothetical protein FisN_21Hh241 [Fistulifera solaris]|uniref:Methyltransferase FkbM domain-containing protein n=1 Tax=Fistulifera solaris TaxID=1519565 RepID=A0A1Z5KPG2_FISSO|nr:hypothetical protein FisN_21Hh241 [Fistulifera solaris]|eukprot:GAX27891.1 hypothetical protein FisN_21Hh241 [Fistulifera solaris]